MRNNFKSQISETAAGAMARRVAIAEGGFMGRMPMPHTGKMPVPRVNRDGRLERVRRWEMTD
jgi:hypothetical protein